MLYLIESYFSVLMLFGTSQAITGIYLLLKEKYRPFSNNLLALLLLVWGFSCYWFFAFIHDKPFFNVAVTTFIGPMLALTLFPPIFLYVKYLFYEHKSFRNIDHLHFTPIYIYIGFTLFLYFDSNYSIDYMRQHDWYQVRTLASSFLATILGPFYFIKTNHILRLRHQMLKEQYSEIESRKLKWFQVINYSFALVFILGGISTIVKIAYLNPYILYMAYHAVIAISLFYITIMIYKYPVIFTASKADSKKDFVLHKVQTSNQDDSDKDILVMLEKIMKEQKLYKDPNLSLSDLAEAISKSRNAVSHALNHGLNKTFYNYINELRIEESKQLFSDENYKHFTIEGIASESGFKTMSVFYKLFKDIEKVTPAVYRKRITNSKSLKNK